MNIAKLYKNPVVPVFFSQGIYVLSLWATLAFLTKFSSAREVGIFTMSTAIVSPIFIFFGLDARQAKISDVNFDYSVLEYLWMRFYGCLLAFLVAGFASLFFGDLQLVWAILAYAFARIFDGLCDLSTGAYLQHNQTHSLFLSMISRGILGAAAFVMAYVYFQQIWIAFIFQALVWACLFLFYDLYRVQKCEFTVSWRNYLKHAMDNTLSVGRLWNLTRMLLPLGIGILFVAIQINVPKYIVFYFEGIEKAGIFSALFYCVTAASIFMTPLENILVKEFSVLLQQRNTEKIYRISLLYATAVFIFSVVSLLLLYRFAPAILTLLYSEEYANQRLALTLLVLAICLRFVSSYMQSLLLATRIFSYHPWLQFLVLACTFLLGVFMVPSYGVVGASCAVMGAALCRILILVFIFSRIWPQRSAA